MSDTTDLGDETEASSIASSSLYVYGAEGEETDYEEDEMSITSAPPATTVVDSPTSGRRDKAATASSASNVCE